MYIDKLSLRNFKCFEKVDISFSKITLFTGPNSSGKSSLLYGLLGPLQSEAFPFYLSPNGKYVNMGDYREIVFSNLRNRSVGIDIVMTDTCGGDEYVFKTDWVCDRSTMMPRLQHLEASLPFMDCEVSSKNAKSYVLKLGYDAKKYLKVKAMRKFYKAVMSMVQEVASELGSLQRQRAGRLMPDLLTSHSIRRRTFGSLEKMRKQVSIINHLPGLLGSMGRDTNFISSFRLQPERTYYQKSLSSEKVGRYGENHIDQILQWEKQKSQQFKELNDILKETRLLYSLRSKQLRGGRFELRVKVRRTGVWSLLPDVGFGISQFLPVVVADLQLSSTSTLFLAQPEIHLHPSVQASLADYFVRQVKSKKKRYILETHSEYLLNRIRLAIAKDQIQASDVSVYYFDSAVGGTKTYEIKFTKNGQIQGAPKSFFETYMIDVMDIALNAK